MRHKGSRARRLSAFARITSVLQRAIPVFFIGVLVFGSMPALAQEVTGSLQGKVVDSTGAVIRGATVELTTEQKTFTTETDSTGSYQFVGIRPGLHSMRVEASGFASQKREDVKLELGSLLTINWTLNAAVAGEEITVTTSEEPAIDTTSTRISTNVTKEEFDLLPKTLNFSSVIGVAPGVRQEDKSAGFTVDGASGAENVFIIDGVEVTRVEDGQLGRTKNVPFDFVREVQIKSAGYEAEYAGATGGVVNVVTRSGQNDFHGEVRFEFENDALAAYPNAPLRLNPFDNRQAQYYDNGNLENEFRLFSPTVSLSGPIVKDHAWFYGSWAPQFEKETQDLRLIRNADNQTTILNSRPITRESTYNYYFGRVDVSPVDSIQAFASFLGSPVYNEGQLVGTSNETTSMTTFLDPRHGYKGGYTPSWNFASGATWNVTDSFVLAFRAGRTYLNDKGTSYDIPIGIPLYQIILPCQTSVFDDCPSGSTAPGAPIISTNFTTLFNITTRTNVNFDGTYIARFFDQQHIIKAGYQYNRLSNKVDEGYQGGIINVYYNSSFGGQRGEYGYWRATDFGTRGDVNSRAQSIFVQDSWTVHPRLTLNLGLRFESEFLPTFPIDATFHPTIDPEQLAGAPDRPIEFGWGDKIAPRIGAAWDVFGDQKLKIYGSFGVFYDTMKYELPRGSFGGDRFLRTWYRLETPNFLALNLANPLGAVIAGPLDFRVPSSLTPEPGEQPGVDPNLEATRQHEYTVGGDWAFKDNMVFGVRFTRKVLDRTIEDVGRHDADGNEIYTIGNPGYGVTQDTTFFAPFPAPRATREYTGLEFRVDKRFSNNWYANVTYLWSKLYGNYTGLASADEVTYATGQGRSSPNVNRYWDFPTLVFDANGQETLGRLPTDRPHTLKAFAGYQFNYWGMSTDINGAQYVYSGTPVSSRVEFLFAEHLAFGREDLGRTDAFSQTDILLTQKWNISERYRLKFSMNVINLFDQRTESVRYELITGPGIDLPLDGSNFPQSAYNDYFSLGTDGVLQLMRDLEADTGDIIFDPRYNLPSIFQRPRYVRFGIGFEF